MDSKKRLLYELNKQFPNPIDLSHLSALTQESPEAISTCLQHLIQQGFPINIHGNDIQLLFPILSKQSIKSTLNTDLFGKKQMIFDTIHSTNTYAKDQLSFLEHGELLLAHEQTAGKGRLGRNWSSAAGKSISMSLILKPENFLHNPTLFTQLTAAALAKALKDTVSVQIKWPNDVLINHKKIAGILTEAEFSGNQLLGVIIGVGINTNNKQEEFSKNLCIKATSLREILNKTVDPNDIVASFLSHFEIFYRSLMKSGDATPFLTVCRENSVLIGKEMWVHDKDEKRKVYINTIDEAGGLVVTNLKTNQTETIRSTHLSIRSEDTYV